VNAVLACGTHALGWVMNTKETETKEGQKTSKSALHNKQ
jgi:hypothetical protein